MKSLFAVLPLFVFMEYLGIGTSEGRVNLHTVTAQGGNLYVYMDYTVQGEVSRIKKNGVASLDVNGLTVSGGVSHIASVGPGDSAWIYDITSTVQTLTVSKTYTVGLQYTGTVTGNIFITKRRRSGGFSESLEPVNFTKNFSGAVVPPEQPVE